MGEIRFRSKRDGKVKFIADQNGKIYEVNKKGIKDKLVSKPEEKKELRNEQ